MSLDSGSLATAVECPHFTNGRCRSCSELPVPYDRQLAAKEDHVRTLLGNCADLRWLPPAKSRESGFRNKAKMVVSGSANVPVLGILGPDGQGIDLRDCRLYPQSMQEAFGPITDFIACARIAPYDIQTRRGELKYILLTEAADGALGLRLVLRSAEPIGRMRKHLSALQTALPALRVVSANLQPEPKAVLEGEHEIVLSQHDRLTMPVNDLRLHLRPQSFFQTNTEIAEALYGQARAWTQRVSPASIWDLYCGVGGFALHCASPGCAVTGIELSAEAIASAEQSSREAKPTDDRSTSIRFIAADALAWARAQPVTDWPELVIVNPPRRGIGAELAQLIDAATNTRWLIYSSCNADSLARDLTHLPSFAAREARLLDMFPQTRHYEVILLLERD